MHLFNDIRRGLASTNRQYQLVPLVWAWHAGLAAIAAWPAVTWWRGALGNTVEASRLLQGFSFGVFGDVLKYGGAGQFSMLGGAAVAAAGLALVTSPFVMGGILSVLGDKGRVHSFMARYFGGGGYFYWRFFRLMLLAGVSAVTVCGLLAVVLAAAAPVFGESEYGTYAGVLVDLIVIKAVAAVFFLGLDYARIRVVQDDSRSMWRAYAGGVAFVLRHLLSTFVAAGVVVTGLVLLFLGYLAYETVSSPASTWSLIAALVLVQQLFALLRTGLRVALVDTEMRIFARLSPAPSLAPASTDPPPPAPAPAPAPSPDVVAD